MSVFTELKDYLSVILVSALVALWAMWKARGRTIQTQEIKIQSQADNADIAPIQAQAQALDHQLEAQDADRIKKDALLNSALGDDKLVSGTDPSDGSKPLP